MQAVQLEPKIDGRTKRRKHAKIPRDVAAFHAAINAATRELDFALRMYSVELKAQGFNDAEITRELLAIFDQAAKTVTKEYVEN